MMNEIVENGNMLIRSEAIVPAVFFADKTAVDKLLFDIETAALSHVPILETAQGRKEIASMAAKVARSKTYLDDMGKTLVSDWKEKSKTVDAHRKIIRDRLDDLKAKVRQPLTDYENAEKMRVENLKERIFSLDSMANITDESGDTLPSESIKAKILEAKKIQIDDTWEEFANDAAKIKDSVLTSLEAAFERKEKLEKEAAELKRLREEQKEREQKEREERIKKEAADAARKAAEEKAAKEKAEAERREREAVEMAEKAERARIAAEERAKIEKELAIKEAEDKARREFEEKEKARIAKEKAQKEEAEKIARNKAHQKTINNAAMVCFEQNGIDTDTAKKVIRLIASGKIDYIRIEY